MTNDYADWTDEDDKKLLAAYGKTSWEELADEAERGYDPRKFRPYSRFDKSKGGGSMRSMTVEFVDNLPGREVGRRHQLVEFADALRANPGRWGKYPRTHSNPKSAYSAASAINHDKFQALLGPEFEATARKENGVVSVYVRYTGQPIPAAAVPAQEAVEPEPVVAAAQEDVAEPSVAYTYPSEQQSVEYTSTT